MIIGTLCFIVVYLIVFIINYKLICIGNQLWPEQAVSEAQAIGFSCMFLIGTVMAVMGLIYVISAQTEFFDKMGSFFQNTCGKFLSKIKNCPPNFKEKDK